MKALEFAGALVLSVAFGGCAFAPAAPAAPAEQDAFWRHLSALCGQAFAGRIAVNAGGPPGPDAFDGKALVMHVRECSGREIRVPFHVGEDASRTWVFTRGAWGLRLKHDHRHRDGAGDALTMYGGDAIAPGSETGQAFPVDAQTHALFTRAGLPQSLANTWEVGIAPGKAFRYGLRRPGRDFRVDFDLTRSVPAPPPPWGAPGK